MTFVRAKKATKKTTKKTSKKKPAKVKAAPKWNKKPYQDGDFSFTPNEKNDGWNVAHKGTAIGCLVPRKEEGSGRHCFAIESDPTERTYRGRDIASQALLNAHECLQEAKKLKATGISAIFVAWEHKARASKQWASSPKKKAAKKSKKKAAKKKTTKKKTAKK